MIGLQHLNIPKDWVVAPLKRFLHVKSGEMISSSEEVEEGIPIIGGNGVRGYTKKMNTESPALVIGRVGAKCGVVHLITKDFWASEHAFVVYPHQEMDLTFGKYLLQFLDFNKKAIRTAQPLINTRIVEETIGVFPPLDVQNKIGIFLNEKTTHIDSLITAKKQLLSLLKEKRQALNTQAVFVGLNQNIEMKDSKIDWLGKIPEHWEIRRMASLFSERDERGEPELPLLEVSVNKGVVVREFSDNKIETVASDFNTYKIARKSDIAFNKMRMWQGAVGDVPLDGLVSPDYTVAYSLGDITPEFSRILFRSKKFSAECARHSRGITWDRLRLYWDGFKNIYIALPPLEEQKAIVKFSSKNINLIDELMRKTRDSINLLEERKTSLVSETVTGQIKIP